jgi:uncharacterized protein YqeY
MSKIERAEETKTGKVVLSDGEVAKVVKKSCKELEEVIGIVNSTVDVSQEINELEILESYLPKQLTEAEIKDAITVILLDLDASTMKDMGKVMGAFNAKYAGQADGKIVSTMVKNLLQ